MSLREQIRDFLISQLNDIKIANGYRNDVKRVSKYLSDIANVRSYPILVVYAGSENFSIAGYGTYAKSLDLFIYGLTGIYRDINESGKVVDANESLIDDVVKCLTNQDNLTALYSTFNIMNSQIVSVAPYVAYNDAGNLVGNIEIVYRITYIE